MTLIVRVTVFVLLAGTIPTHAYAQSLSDALESIAEEFHSRWNAPGARAGQRAELSTSAVKLVDPMKYRRISALDNDNPDSLFYTYRPNIFNVQIEDEWDWLNLINTDRPDFTDTPFTAGKGNTLLETGLTNTKTDGPDAHTEIRTLPESLFRIGITDHFELRIKWLGYQMINQEDTHTGVTGSVFGGADVDVGFKWNLTEQDEWRPMTTLVTGLLLPTGTNAMSGNSVQPHFNLVQGWHLRRYIFLKHQFGLDYLTQPDYNVGPVAGTSFGILSGSRPTVDAFHSSISCLYQATKHIGGFVEWFATYGPDQFPVNYTDLGFFVYLTPSIQFDGVYGTSIAAPDMQTQFVKAGFSTRW